MDVSPAPQAPQSASNLAVAGSIRDPDFAVPDPQFEDASDSPRKRSHGVALRDGHLSLRELPPRSYRERMISQVMPASHLPQDHALVWHHSMLVRMILSITHQRMMSMYLLLVLEGVVHENEVLVVHP